MRWQLLQACAVALLRSTQADAMEVQLLPLDASHHRLPAIAVASWFWVVDSSAGCHFSETWWCFYSAELGARVQGWESHKPRCNSPRVRYLNDICVGPKLVHEAMRNVERPELFLRSLANPGPNPSAHFIRGSYNSRLYELSMIHQEGEEGRTCQQR